jgi:hypothetical protein
MQEMALITTVHSSGAFSLTLLARLTLGGRIKPAVYGHPKDRAAGRTNGKGFQMCRWASAIVTRSGEIYFNPLTDSHSDLITLYKLKEGKNHDNFIRVEFYPSEGKHDDLKSYVLKVDETRTPGWFDDERKANTEKYLRDSIERMVVRDKRELLLGGAWILSKGADVVVTKQCRIIAMRESSKVGVMQESSKVGVMWESSKVGVMQDSSNVGVMWGSSKVGEMRDSSKVGVMQESSKVGVMRESSKVGVMRGSSKVGVMWGSSNVGEMLESSKVGLMWGSSKVGVMWGRSNVGEDERVEAKTK